MDNVAESPIGSNYAFIYAKRLHTFLFTLLYIIKWNQEMNKNRYTKKWEILVNTSSEEQTSREPLLAFSFILSTRHNQLATIADEILDNLDKGISREVIDSRYVTKAGILVWLWVLGAYEVVRTMCQAKSSFETEYLENLHRLKKRLAKVRMPDAKMEKRGKSVPVSSDRSPWCEVIKTQDLLIGDPEEADSAREIMDDYFKTIDSLEENQIFEKHEESYS